MNSDAICSFCGKSQNEVKRLISSPDTLSYICDNCVDICKEIIKEQETNKMQKFSFPTPKELKEKLDEYIIGQENAKKALSLKIGARGLRTIMEESMLNLMFDAPSQKQKQKIVISCNHITNKAPKKEIAIVS